MATPRDPLNSTRLDDKAPSQDLDARTELPTKRELELEERVKKLEEVLANMQKQLKSFLPQYIPQLVPAAPVNYEFVKFTDKEMTQLITFGRTHQAEYLSEIATSPFDGVKNRLDSMVMGTMFTVADHVLDLYDFYNISIPDELNPTFEKIFLNSTIALLVDFRDNPEKYKKVGAITIGFADFDLEKIEALLLEFIRTNETMKTVHIKGKGIDKFKKEFVAALSGNQSIIDLELPHGLSYLNRGEFKGIATPEENVSASTGVFAAPERGPRAAAEANPMVAAGKTPAPVVGANPMEIAGKTPAPAARAAQRQVHFSPAAEKDSPAHPGVSGVFGAAGERHQPPKAGPIDAKHRSAAPGSVIKKPGNK